AAGASAIARSVNAADAGLRVADARSAVLVRGPSGIVREPTPEAPVLRRPSVAPAPRGVGASAPVGVPTVVRVRGRSAMAPAASGPRGGPPREASEAKDVVLAPGPSATAVPA